MCGGSRKGLIGKVAHHVKKKKEQGDGNKD